MRSVGGTRADRSATGGAPGIIPSGRTARCVQPSDGPATGTGGQPVAPAASSPAARRERTPATSVSPFSFAFPAPASTIPDFFISSFQIPPFLLPIYQAAGVEYDVPWPVLAAINEVETDYGRNLSISSAGAVGWMQFLPTTWEHYGVDATNSGYADPYNPVDAIFAAARYLHAAGASTSLASAVYAYNHASWYVQSVLLRAELIGGIPEGLIDALSELVEGRFPVAARASYLDAGVTSREGQRAGRPSRRSQSTLTLQPPPRPSSPSRVRR